MSTSLSMGAVTHRPSGPLPGSLEEMLDFRSIPYRKAWKTFQASGYDRGGGFYDSGNFLRIESDNHYVLMETEGPGCIDRMWFTYKKALGKEPYDLVLYLDDVKHPVIQMNLDEFFSGRHPPFVLPLAGLCGLPEQPGRFNYVPIGFTKYCKVLLCPTADPEQYNYRLNSAGQKIPHIYYQITYRKFPIGASVRHFQWRLEASEQAALEQVTSAWNAAGYCPWENMKGLRKASSMIQLQSEQKHTLWNAEGSGVVYTVQFRLPNPQEVELEMAWDDAAEPQVRVPFGPFFACSLSHSPRREVSGFWAGFSRDRYYCFLPMPFQRQARISLVSHSEQPIEADCEITYRMEHVGSQEGRFYAHRYDYLPSEPGKDYEVLHVRGAGHFVGLVMDQPGHMEGDDRFYIDNETVPSLHGTGTEDFFNFAWGLSHAGPLPMHGITLQTSPVAYRFHLPAGVPFATSIQILWEHGHDPELGSNQDLSRYSGVVFYYRNP